MDSLEEIQQSIAEEFEIFDTWMEKYEYIIDLGKKLETFPSDQMIDENKVHGLSIECMVFDFNRGWFIQM